MKLTKNKKAILMVCCLSLILTPCLVLADWAMPAVAEYPGVPEDLDNAVINATNWLLGFVAMIAVLAIVWGGVNYIGSVGDEERVRTAKKTISYGIIGVVIAGFAYAIVNVIVTVIL